MKTVEIEVFGKVQGVFFRASTLNEAKKLGLTGWVKNTSQGTVLIECQGEDQSVDSLIDYCKTGPEYAIVKEVRIKMIRENIYEGFEIKE